MTHYREALSNYVSTSLGGAALPSSTNAQEVLIQNLREVMRADAKYFNLCVIVVLTLYVGAFAFVMANLKSPGWITTTFSVTGVSITSLIKQMISLWREKSHSEAALILATALAPDDLKAVIAILLKGK